MADTPLQREAPLLQKLEALGIHPQLQRHPALHTVEESKALADRLPGLHVKNLFLRDKKARLWLLTVQEDRQIDLKALRHRLGAAGTLSFGSAELLERTLGISPGAATPLAILNDRARLVSSVLDQSLLAAPWINVHPLHNEATVALSPRDLLQFLNACEHPPVLLDFDGA